MWFSLTLYNGHVKVEVSPFHRKEGIPIPMSVCWGHANSAEVSLSWRVHGRTGGLILPWSLSHFTSANLPALVSLPVEWGLILPRPLGSYEDGVNAASRPGCGIIITMVFLSSVFACFSVQM